MSPIALLGPQRFKPSVDEALDRLGIPQGGPQRRLAVVTAGWQERESEIDELRDHVRCDTVNLELHRRGAALDRDDPELATALRDRQEELRQVQRLYRSQLARALDSARELFGGEGVWVEDHRRSAIRVIKQLDRHHLARVRAVHERFEQDWSPTTRPSIARHRAELAAIVESCGALLIAGGHVVALLNRLRLFGVADLVGERPIVAWSAGAMALSDRVVLFHDSPPQGPGDAEVLDAGLGRARGLVLLPHAKKRLRLEDASRVGLMARRFSPAACVPLDDDGTGLICRGAEREAIAELRRLGRTGRLSRYRA